MAESDADWDLTTDLVIVGSGGGGLCAALTARAQGLDVLVLEKADVVGGSTALSGGGLWIPNNPVMRAAGVADSEAEALKYFDSVVGDVGPASSLERRQAYVENAPRVITFLQQLGIPFKYSDGYSDQYSDRPGGMARGRTLEALPFDATELGAWTAKLRPGSSTALRLVGMGTELSKMPYYHRHPRNALIGARVLARTEIARRRKRTLVSNGAALVGRLLKAVIDRGIPLWTEAPVRELVVTDGVVTGVVVSHEGRDKRIGGRRGVLLAAGGFSRNDEMRARYGGEQAHSGAWTSANPGDTGEVMQLAMALGAGTALMDEAIWLPGPRMPDAAPPNPAYGIRPLYAFARMRWRPGTIMVDASGKRFANESGSFMDLAQRMFQQDKTVKAIPSWLIFDDRCRRQSLFGVVPGKLPEQWITDGFVKRADTLAELAAQCGIDAAGLADTVERFNAFARTGTDADFRRGESAYDRFMGDPRHKPNNCLAPVERGPFYAVAWFPGDLGTCGGVLTDEHARVLTESGQPIPGLYATGNVTATIMGRHYLGAGASIGPTCTFAYIAVNHIAAQPTDVAATGA